MSMHAAHTNVNAIKHKRTCLTVNLHESWAISNSVHYYMEFRVILRGKAKSFYLVQSPGSDPAKFR